MASTAEELVSVMREHWPTRDVYLGASGGYFMSHGGGPVERRAIDAALTAGWIKPKWPDRPDLEYWHLTDQR